MGDVGRGMVGGQLAGTYELTGHLRPGRFGDFWRGRRLADGSPVAIKLLKVELFADANAVQRFHRETRALAAFRHDNLLEVVEHGVTPAGAPWIVTEPHDGRVLSDLVADLELTVDTVCDVGAQIADVLDAAHKLGIVHRGLDPEAIVLLERSGGGHHVKVQDFGLAHLPRPSDSQEPALTKVGERLGRTESMAPETIEDHVFDARTDLYAFGILLFEMLTGQPPFVGRPVAVLRKHVEEQPAAPSELATEDVPPWLDALVLSLLEKDPDRRPQSGAVVAKMLRRQT